MGSQVMVVLKVMPEGPGAEKEVRKALEGLDGFDVKDIQEEPVAFGMVALKVGVLLQDQPQVLEKLEEAIKALEGVSEVEVEATTLI